MNRLLYTDLDNLHRNFSRNLIMYFSQMNANVTVEQSKFNEVIISMNLVHRIKII